MEEFKRKYILITYDTLILRSLYALLLRTQ
jgi:hypothetical protein